MFSCICQLFCCSQSMLIILVLYTILSYTCCRRQRYYPTYSDPTYILLQSMFFTVARKKSELRKEKNRENTNIHVHEWDKIELH